MKIPYLKYDYNTLINLLVKADSVLPPEISPNYPHPETWKETNGVNPDKMRNLWRKSYLKNKKIKPVIYVHIPFCQYICKFCGFYKKLPEHSKEIDVFIEYLEKEVSYFKNIFESTSVRWLCFGGGTPSMLNENQLIKLFEIFKKNFNISRKTGIALESNPQTLTYEKAKFLKELGVNFLAIGIQSFNEKLMKKLNRPQTEKQCISAIKNAKKAGIENIEADFIAGLPGQTEDIFLSDIKKISKFDLERIYIFDYQPRAFSDTFKEKSPSLNSNHLETTRLWREKAIEILLKNGYKMRCGHWVYKRKGGSWPYSYDQQEDDCYSIIGFGPTSIGYARDYLRYWNVSSLNKYITLLKNEKLPVLKFKELTKEDEMRNYIIVSLLHRNQFNLTDFKKRFKKDFLNEFNEEYSIFKKEDMISEVEDNIILKNRGLNVNKLRTIFYTENDFRILSQKYNMPIKRKKSSLSTANYDDSKILVVKNIQKINIENLIYKRKNKQEEIIIIPEKLDNLTQEYENLVKSIVDYINKLKYEKAYIYLENLNSKIKHYLTNNNFETRFFILSPFKNNKTDDPTIFPALFINKKNINRLENILKKFPREKVFIIYPYLSKQKLLDNYIISYSELKKYFKKLFSKYKNIQFINVLPCILNPDYKFFFNTSNKNCGDLRESPKEVIKLRECNRCKFLLQCPGPDKVYIEKFGIKEIKAVK